METGLRQFEAIAQALAEAIACGVYRPGDRLPSIRQSSRTHGVAMGTALRAYDELEARGLIEARARSGYFVSAPRVARLPEPEQTTPARRSTPVEVSELVFRLLDEIKIAGFAPPGSAFPSPELFPLATLSRVAASAARRLDRWSSVRDLPPGNAELRRLIAKRYQLHGCAVQPDDILITNGALEAIGLSLQALTRPGDAVAIKSPTFYATLQAIERLGLRAVEVATHARTGIDLSELERAIRTQRVHACILMTSFQNPLGSTLDDDKKRDLVALLQRHSVPLIEDDVYAELHHGALRPRPAKYFDRSGQVLHCGSFAKCLAPGFRVGWVAAGRWHEAVRRLKLMTSIATASIPQAALASYLRDQPFDRHLRSLRASLASQLQSMVTAIDRYFPPGCRASRPEGGYLLWVELPEQIDALQLHAQAEKEQISIAPGPLFSPQRRYRNCIRLNFGHPWTGAMEAAMRRLGELITAAR
jgi:DNA-binding transcriptional MocR family regulator